VTRLALRRRALERLVAQGREACGRAVRERLGAELAPLVPGVAEEIAAQLRAKLGRLHPPAVADRTG
jgi:hypothetical protein